MKLPIQKYHPNSSRLALGCMGFGGGWDDQPYQPAHVQQMASAVEAALDNNINFFDHADIYTMGKAESVFGEVLKSRPSLRQDIIIQSKCGIKFDDELAPGRYDFSYEWIINSVDGILRRLHTEWIDILVLHRPDPLMEVDEIGRAFSELQYTGKVKHFGVSNMHAHQIDYLQQSLDITFITNQVELSLKNVDWLNESVSAGMSSGAGHHFSPGLLEYNRLQGCQIQAWGCLAQGLYSGRDLQGQPESVHKTAGLVSEYAEQFGVSREAIVLAWLLRHPYQIQPVIGTTNPERINACAQAESVNLTREQWYSLYVASRGERLP
ncbi:MAG: aldo/keto reductase [Alteromonadaceae bacterium]|nr:aldo/keto reductase [Alteromonadaceae bacterium]